MLESSRDSSHQEDHSIFTTKSLDRPGQLVRILGFLKHQRYFREQIGARDANKMMVFDGATAAGNGRFRVSNAKSAWTRQGCLAENSYQTQLHWACRKGRMMNYIDTMQKLFYRSLKGTNWHLG